MSIVHEFVKGLPFACGVPKEIADIEGDRLGRLYVYDAHNPDSVFNRQPGQTERQRLSRAFAGWSDLAHPAILEYAERLLCLAAKASAFNSKGIGNEIEIQAEAATMRVFEPGFPTVSALMTVDQAVSPQSSWA